MTLRKGLTTQDLFKFTQLVNAGKTWDECKTMLRDVDFKYVKEHFYEPMRARYELAQKKSNKPSSGTTTL